MRCSSVEQYFSESEGTRLIFEFLQIKKVVEVKSRSSIMVKQLLNCILGGVNGAQKLVLAIKQQGGTPTAIKTNATIMDNLESVVISRMITYRI